MSILEARKAMPWASAAAVRRQHRGSTVHVFVTLLEGPASPQRGDGQADADGRAQVIAEFAARRLGEDLATAFGAKDVIILR
jgi:hypothetical protein